MIVDMIIQLIQKIPDRTTPVVNNEHDLTLMVSMFTEPLY